MNKNSFNLRRCWSLLKGDLRNNRTDILLLAGVLFLVVIAVALFSVFTPSLTFSQATGITLSGAEIAALTAISNIGLVVMVAEVVIFSRVFANAIGFETVKCQLILIFTGFHLLLLDCLAILKDRNGRRYGIQF